jgi:hypothetical protein
MDNRSLLDEQRAQAQEEKRQARERKAKRQHGKHRAAPEGLDTSVTVETYSGPSKADAAALSAQEQEYARKSQEWAHQAQATGVAASAPSQAERQQGMVWAESVRPAVIATKSSPCNCYTLFAALLQVALVVTVILALTERDGGSEPASDHSGHDSEHKEEKEFGGVIGGILLCMIIEVCICPSARYLRNILLDNGAYQHVETVRRSPPEVHWHIRCYHYETIHYTETHEDADGNKRTEHKTRTKRRDTYFASFTYRPYYWEDISSPFPDIGTASLTRLTFDKQVVFADMESREHFNRKKREFIWTNRRDVHYDFSETLEIPGSREYVLACKDPSDIPLWLNQWMYYLASLFCLTVPYRIAFAQMCYEVPEYRYIKRFYSKHRQLVPCPVPVLSVSTQPLEFPTFLYKLGACLWNPFVKTPKNKRVTASGMPGRHASGAGRAGCGCYGCCRACGTDCYGGARHRDGTTKRVRLGVAAHCYW